MSPEQQALVVDRVCSQILPLARYVSRIAARAHEADADDYAQNAMVATIDFVHGSCEIIPEADLVQQAKNVAYRSIGADRVRTIRLVAHEGQWPETLDVVDPEDRLREWMDAEVMHELTARICPPGRHQTDAIRREIENAVSAKRKVNLQDVATAIGRTRQNVHDHFKKHVCPRAERVLAAAM